MDVGGAVELAAGAVVTRAEILERLSAHDGAIAPVDEVRKPRRSASACRTAARSASFPRPPSPSAGRATARA